MTNSMRYLKKIWIALVLVPAYALAQSSQANQLPAPTSDTTIQDFIVHVLQAIVDLALPAIAVAIVWSGFLYVSAQGKPEKLKTAHRNFLYVCVGSAFILGAWALVTILGNTVSKIIGA